ncbi:hypothetical protein AB1Y20_002021 [Prymnesium parvum]|uniref:Fe2OG dioxygenase domain-containing protein n=1 Tax=Prymnesium parvum TaxID=97485 RepID=A0AB34J6T5_PRYPA
MRGGRREGLRQLEASLLREGYLRLPFPEAGGELELAATAVYDAAAAFLRSPAEERRQHEHEAASSRATLGFTYLPMGAEPLYDGTSEQRVHSLSIHSALSEAECDALLPRGMDGEARALAHSYHRWPDDEGLAPLRRETMRLRRLLLEQVCEPLLASLSALLGLGEGGLKRRCCMRGSDNTSLLRLMEYPPAAEGEMVEGPVVGVSEHTDYELLSVLHQDREGLEVRNRSGEWVLLPHDDRMLTVLIGDMTERLSAGYFTATPHRVRATPAGKPPRCSFVFFLALDEDERVCGLSSSAVRGADAAPFSRWLESLPDKERRKVLLPITQREWTESKDAAALAALRDKVERSSRANRSFINISQS